MSSRSHSNRSSSPHPSSDRFAAALYQVIESTMRREFAERYDAALQLRCINVATRFSSMTDTSVLRLRVDCRGLTQMMVRMTVTRSRTGTFDVLCTVPDGNTHPFSYHCPTRTEAPEPPGTLILGRDIAAFLRTELENRLGRLLLQSPARPPTHTILGLC
jgi:hypothetical protein